MEIALVNNLMYHTFVLTMKTRKGGEIYHSIGTPLDVLNKKIESEYGIVDLVSVERVDLIDAPKGLDIKLEDINIHKLSVEELLLLAKNEIGHHLEEQVEIKQAYENARKKTL